MFCWTGGGWMCRQVKQSGCEGHGVAYHWWNLVYLDYKMTKEGNGVQIQETENVTNKQSGNSCVYSDELSYSENRPFLTMTNYAHVTSTDFKS